MRTLAPALLAAIMAAPAIADDRALVIGIDDYTMLAEPVVLGHAVPDARRFADFLIARAGFDADQITVLTDDGATADAIIAALIDRLLGETAAGDRIVIYFAGLGTTVAGTDGAPVPTLIAADGDTALGLMPADLFAELLDLAADRQVTLVIDAGFAADAAPPGGAVARSRPSAAGPVSDLAAFGAGPGRELWTAAQPGAFAWESADGGVLTAFLLEGMAGSADRDADRIVTGAELEAHVTTRMQGWCAGVAACGPGGLIPLRLGPADGAAFIPAELLPQVQSALPDDAPLTYEEMLGFVVDLYAPTNPAGLDLGISAAQPMAIGTAVTFEVTSSLSGGLILLDIDPQGRLMQIFPSALAPEEGDRIAADQRIVIPSGSSANGLPLRVTVTGPTGRGILLALFTEGDPARLAQVLPPGLAEGAMTEAGQHLYAIAQELLRRDADPAGRLNWSAAYLPYEIVP